MDEMTFEKVKPYVVKITNAKPGEYSCAYKFLDNGGAVNAWINSSSQNLISITTVSIVMLINLFKYV